ncbi:MAG: MFS transporter [Pseudoxanthomonas sp.]
MSRPSQTLPGAAALAPAAAAPALGRIRIALFLGGFSTFSLLYCVQPLLPEFAHEFGLDAASSSLPLSLATMGLALAIFVAGAVSENLGRRGLMFASILTAALLNLAAALAPHWGTLVLARALSGIALGGVPAVAMTYMAEEIPHEKLGAATGLYVGGNAFGGMAGRMAVGFLTDHYGWRAAMAAVSVSGVLCAVGFVLLLPASRHFVRRQGVNLGYHLHAWGGHLLDRHMRRLCAIPFLLMGAFVSVYNYAAFRLGGPEFGLSQSQIGWIFGAYLFGIVASSLAGALSDRFGRGPVVVAGSACALAGIALTLAHALAVVVAGVVLLTAGFFVAHSAASAWVSRLGRHSRGHAASLYLLAYYTGSSLLGWASGWAWQHGGWPLLAGFCLTLAALACVAAQLLRRQADDSRPYGRFAPHPPRGE